MHGHLIERHIIIIVKLGQPCIFSYNRSTEKSKLHYITRYIALLNIVNGELFRSTSDCMNSLVVATSPSLFSLAPTWSHWRGGVPCFFPVAAREEFGGEPSFWANQKLNAYVNSVTHRKVRYHYAAWYASMTTTVMEHKRNISNWSNVKWSNKT